MTSDSPDAVTPLSPHPTPSPTPRPTESDFAEPVGDISVWHVANCKHCGRRIRKPVEIPGVPPFSDACWRHIAMGPVNCFTRAKPLPLDLDDD